MAESVLQKMEFPHPLVQVQAVKQIAAIARKKIEGIGKLGKSNAELDILWNKCCNPANPTIGSTCVDAFVTLVKDGILDGNAVISTAVNYASSSHNVQWLLQLIGELLKLHILNNLQTEVVQYRCPYNLRSPPHPFIFVLISKDKAWSPVCSQIECQIHDSLSDDFISPIVLEVMKPAIIYILLNPSESSDVLLSKCRIYELLVNLSNSLLSVGNKLAFDKLLDEILWPALAYNDVNRPTISFNESLVKIINEKIDRPDISRQIIIYLKLLKFCKDDMTASDKACAIQSMKNIASCLEEKCDVHLELCIIGIVHVLKEYPVDNLSNILNLCDVLIKLNSVKRSQSPLHLQMLRVSLLQLQLFLGMKSSEKKIMIHVNNLLKECAKLIQECNEFSSFNEKKTYTLGHSLLIDEWIFHLLSFASLSNRLLSSEHLERWIKSIEHSITNKHLVKDEVISIAFLHCIFLLYYIETNGNCSSSIVCLLLNNLKLFAKHFPYLSFSLLPVLLYALKISNSSVVMCEICCTLPALASHPYCVTPIMNLLHSLALESSLKPMALRLMLDIWQSQDRSYPHLQKMILSQSELKKKHGSFDLQLLKAFAMNKICMERAHLYGSDILKLIVPVIKTSPSSKFGLARLSLALESLFHLCQNGVLSLKTMWDELGDTLRSHTQGNLAKKVLEILSLVPDLTPDASEYEIFREDILKWIWTKVICSDTKTTGAAFISLSKYNSQDFKVGYLPVVIQPERIEAEDEEIFLEKPVPGYCYMKLASHIPANFKEYEIFMDSILQQELSNLPRDIHHRALKSQRHASQPKPLQEIPHFILNFYEKNKNPSLRTSLASSLLLCHNPIPDLDANGKPVMRTVVSQGRNFMQLMQVLLKEVPVEPNSWQSILWCCHGWKVFMKRCFQAMTDSRQAELQMQLQRISKDNKEDEEDILQKLATASLWCREKIMTALKTASKGNPIMQGNAVLALSGLLIAINTLESTNEEGDIKPKSSSDDIEYLSLSHWTTMAIDTIISIANPKHISTGRIFSWCQYRSVSSTGRLSTTHLGNICAIHALPMVASVAVPKYIVKIMEIMKFLSLNLTKNLESEKEQDENRGSLKFHCSISIGRVWSILYQGNFQELNGQEGQSLLSQSFADLHNNVMKIQSENKEDLGALLGFGLALASKFKHSNPTNSQECKILLKELLQLLHNDNSDSPQYTNVLCIVLGWAYMSAYANNAIDVEEAKILIKSISVCVSKNRNNAELSGSLGTLCNGLFLSGAGEITEEMNSLFEQWYKTIVKHQVPTRQRLSAMAGVSALVGSNSNISPQAIEPIMLGIEQYQSKLTAVIKVLQHLSRNSNDVGVPNRSIILLGHFYASFESTLHVKSSAIPASYDYLPNSSALKYVYSSIAETGKSFLHTNESMLQILLNCLCKNACKFKLPPVNWAVSLPPILGGEYSIEVKNKAFEIILSQCSDSPTCASLITSWMSNPRFNTLHVTSLMLFYRNLDKIVKCQTDMKIASFLEASVTQCLTSMTEENELSCTLYKAILLGLSEALKLSKVLISGIPEIMYNTVERFFMQLPFDCDSTRHLEAMWMLAKCMELLPDANIVVGRYETEDANEKDKLKSLFIRCCCTVKGSHPLSLCNKAIEFCGKCKDVARQAMWICAVCFQGVASLEKSIPDQMNWMQEIMGRLKSIIMLQNMDESNARLFKFLFNIFSIAALCWSHMGIALGISSDYCHENINFQHEVKLFEKECKLYLPLAMNRLLSLPGWDRMIQPTIDWLIFMQQQLYKVDNNIDSEWCITISNTLYSLRHTKAYQKPSNWCKILASIHHLG